MICAPLPKNFRKLLLCKFIKFLQAVYRLRIHCRMEQWKEIILNMDKCSTNFNAIKVSVSMALLSFSARKDSGMAQNQAVSQKVTIYIMNIVVWLFRFCKSFRGSYFIIIVISPNVSLVRKRSKQLKKPHRCIYIHTLLSLLNRGVQEH